MIRKLYLLTLLVFTANALSASFTLNFVYIQNLDETRLEYSGSWDVDSTVDSSRSSSPSNINRNQITNIYDSTVGYSRFDYGGFSVSTPWEANSDPIPSSVSGDNFAFSNGSAYGPFEFSAGDLISGSMVWAGRNLTELGFLPEDINSSGSFLVGGPLGDAAVMNWSTQSVIPEPASTTLIVGLFGFVFVVLDLRRRKNYESA